MDVILDKEHFCAKLNELLELKILQILRNYLTNIRIKESRAHAKVYYVDRFETGESSLFLYLN